jgi:hypothetical protein
MSEPVRFVEPEDARNLPPWPVVKIPVFPDDKTLHGCIIAALVSTDPSRPRGMPPADDDVRPDFERGEG